MLFSPCIYNIVPAFSDLCFVLDDNLLKFTLRYLFLWWLTEFPHMQWVENGLVTVPGTGPWSWAGHRVSRGIFHDTSWCCSLEHDLTLAPVSAALAHLMQRRLWQITWLCWRERGWNIRRGGWRMRVVAHCSIWGIPNRPREKKRETFFSQIRETGSREGGSTGRTVKVKA